MKLDWGKNLLSVFLDGKRCVHDVTFNSQAAHPYVMLKTISADCFLESLGMLQTVVPSSLDVLRDLEAEHYTMKTLLRALS